GVPEANISLKNLTNKTIDYCEVKFTCYDAHNKVTTDYPSLYNGTFKGYSNDNINPYGKVTWAWTLYSNEKTFSIGNIYMVFIRYTDGTTWSR
ncbi:MAG: hypothetical protein J6036_06570, partial [Clostridia bacterium]|nr:hypothetical protein [Clostridia bacterium]